MNRAADDDYTVTYALRGAVAWGSLAMSRALLDEGRAHGDPMLDRLMHVQAELTKLRKDWKNRIA